MNTSRKGTVVKECDQCDRNFMVVGDTPIRLAQHRTASLDKHGTIMHGVCPLHQK